ncbi:SDR family oxidoreductase [Litoreibacter roseus]|nr:SDR family oxidoreductase [Litoreibacter roseus]
MVRRVLLIGGTGVFGARLARHLAGWDEIELFVSSRNTQKARRFAKELTGSGSKIVKGVDLDRGNSLQARLEEIKPFAVVDCSGPFQAASYETARAVIKAGAHLIDLADARDYLAGFADSLNEVACQHSVTALTGASSTPTLSSCVVAHLTKNWQRVDTIDICITPGGKSEVGRAVIEAILSYAGKAVPVWRAGHLDQITGWTKGQSVDIPNLGRRRVAPVETFDAEYLGPKYNVRGRVAFSAGLESNIEQWGLEAMATLRERGLFPDPQALIPLLLKARMLTRLSTSDKGAMLVEIRGLDPKGTFTQARWSLLAKNDHGPYIPILPAAAALRKLLGGAAPVGARLADQALSLSDILEQMVHYSIKTEAKICQESVSIFETQLGTETFQDLPDALRDFHGQTGDPVWSGTAQIEGGKWVLPKLLSRFFGFPATGVNIPVTVQVDRSIEEDGLPRERWTRNFDGTILTSALTRARDGVFTEKFALFTFDVPVSAGSGTVKMPVSGFCLGRLRLPRVLAPRSNTVEYQDTEGRFCFDVRLTLPLVGLLAHYKGWLMPTGQHLPTLSDTSTVARVDIAEVLPNPAT